MVEGRILGKLSTQVKETPHGATEPLSDEHETEQDSLVIKTRPEEGVRMLNAPLQQRVTTRMFLRAR